MSDCSSVAQMLTEHALGLLGVPDADTVDGHIEICDECAEELQQLSAIVVALEIEHHARLRAAETSAPLPHDLRDGVFQAVAAAPRTPARSSGATATVRRVAATRPHTRSGFSGLLRQRPRLRTALGFAPSLALGAACLVLVVQLAERGDRIDALRDQLDRARDRPTLAALKSASIEDLKEHGEWKGEATAQVVVGEDTGLVTIRNVPAPPEGMLWQVWQVDTDDRITKLAIIEEASSLEFVPLEDIDPDELQRIIITAEPASGESDEPADEPVAEHTFA